MKTIKNHLQIITETWLEEWRSEAKTQQPNSEHFGDTLAAYYGDSPVDHRLTCMVTNIRLPLEDVRAAHIVPWARRHAARVLLDISADDPGNGLLWCLPLEQAWTDQKFAFSYPGG